MEKKIILSERNHNKDDIKLHRNSVAYNRGEVSFVDETTNEIIFQARNKVILPGAAFTARKHFNLAVDEVTPSYNDALGLDNTVHETAPSEEAEKVFLFSVGIDGGGREPSQIYPVNYGKWTNPGDLVPFRYQPLNSDLGDELRDSYFGRKTYNAQKRIAYYFKAFDIEPTFHQQYVDGTPIDSTVYESEKEDEIETYVELVLKITSEDCREFFNVTTGPNTARINSLQLLTAWAKEVDGKTYYQDIRPLTKLHFPLESLIDITKSIKVIYHLYY